MKSTGSVRAVGAAIAACLTVGAGSAAAYTVRPPELQSYLGQPLRMMIRIDLSPGEQAPESVQLASPEDITRLGLDGLVERSSALRLRQEEGSNGLEVYIDSAGGLSEPMFAVVLEVRRGDLRTLHQVTVMLDPVPADQVAVTRLADASPASASAQPLTAAPPVPSPHPATKAVHSGPAVSHTHHHTAASTMTARWTGGDSYGPVRHGETLSGIARKVRADRHVSINELVKALVALNPRATHGRESFVAEGATLQLPRELAAGSSSAASAQATPAPVPAPLPVPAAPAAVAAAPAPAESPKASTPATTAVEGSSATQPSRFQMATSLGGVQAPATAPAETPAAATTAANATEPAAAAPAVAAPAESAPAAPAAAATPEKTPASATPSVAENHPAAVAATPVAAQTVARPGVNLLALGGLGALLAAAAAGLLMWARRGGAPVTARDSAVLTPRGANDSVSATAFDIDAALAERSKKAAELSGADRVVLLKQAYAARGKRVRDVK